MGIPPAEPDFAVVDLRPATAGSLVLIETLALIDQLLAADPAARIVLLSTHPDVGAERPAGVRTQRYLAAGDRLRALLPLAATPEPAMADPAPRSLRAVEWAHIQRMLAIHRGNKAAAARALRIDLSTLRRKLARAGRSTASRDQSPPCRAQKPAGETRG